MAFSALRLPYVTPFALPLSAHWHIFDPVLLLFRDNRSQKSVGQNTANQKQRANIRELISLRASDQARILIVYQEHEAKSAEEEGFLKQGRHNNRNDCRQTDRQTDGTTDGRWTDLTDGRTDRPTEWQSGSSRFS